MSVFFGPTAKRVDRSRHIARGVGGGRFRIGHGFLEIPGDRQDTRYSHPSFAFSSSFTAAGLACPLLSLHHLAHQVADHAGLSRFVLLHLLGTRGDYFVDDFLQRAGVADLAQAFAIDNRRGRFAGLKHFGENILGHLAADFAFRDERHQLAQLLGEPAIP